MNPMPIAVLQRKLLAEFERDSDGTRAAAILAEYASQHEDWRRFALFDDTIYTRNLVGRNPDFEMLVLCWNRGQTSPIHNHAGQNCWMAVLEGEIEEVHYNFAAGTSNGRLIAGATKVFGAGRVAFINDEIALHRVCPRDGQRGISLHVYSKPIDACNVYDEHSGHVVRRQLAYHSVEGIRSAT